MALPASINRWQTMMAASGQSVASTIHDASSVPSASKMELKDFLLLRVLWEPHDLSAFTQHCGRKGGYVSNEALKRARQTLEKLGFRKYLKSFVTSGDQPPVGPYHVDLDLGPFALARHQQFMATQTELDNNDDQLMSKVLMSPGRVVTRSATARAEDNMSPTNQTRSSTFLQSMRQEVRQSSSESSALSGGVNMSPASRSVGDTFLKKLRRSLQQSSSRGSGSGSSTGLNLGSPMSAYIPTGAGTQSVFPAIDDEQIVNTALLLFLNSLVVLGNEQVGHWSLYRQPFAVLDKNDKKVYEARVDGFFKRKDQSLPCMIMEVKPFIRDQNLSKIRCQEGAQMAAFIAACPPELGSFGQSSFPGQRYKRVLISQDRHVIYVTVAHFDVVYVRYIRSQSWTNDPPSFLVMKEYGPFDTTNEDDMKGLAQVMLAFCYQGGAY